ncbi:MAG: amidophosphoribosyltransferase [Patescibacteria group bacterium]|jgi:amidophosphoribosyltransferase
MFHESELGVGKGPEFSETPKDHCGIVGMYMFDGVENKANIFLGAALYALQHRGQEGFGIYGENRYEQTIHERREGLVNQPETRELLAKLKSPKIVLGQTRYSTSGKLDAWQPVHANNLTLVHNGNITNAMELLSSLPQDLQESAVSDTDIVFKAMLSSKQDSDEDKIRDVLEKVEGAANFIISTHRKLIASRDPWGFRPLILGKLPSNAGVIVASEDNFFQNFGIEYIREIEPGEAVMINDEGIHPFFTDPRKERVAVARCIFEHVYIGDPNSHIFERPVYAVRQEIGKALARKDIAQGFLPDVVVPVQHSGIIYGEGYRTEMVKQLLEDPSVFGLSQEEAANHIVELSGTTTPLIANIYAGRVFILPDERYQKAHIKHMPIKEMIAGRKVVVIDDSIVRGDTSRTTVAIVRDAGATEVHLRSGSPQLRSPCFMGVDFATNGELIAHRCHSNLEEIRNEIGCDSLRYTSVRDLVTASLNRYTQGLTDEEIFELGQFCGACFTGTYPNGINPLGVYSK